MGILTGYLKEILAGLLVLSIVWVGSNVSATKSAVKLINKDIGFINEKLGALSIKVDKVFMDRYTGTEAKEVNNKVSSNMENLKDKVHALELKIR